MKVNLLDASDRYQHFIKQDFDISACCQDLIDKRPFGNVPFYIFAHARTDDDGIKKRLIWQPRLTKPSAQSNSMLFKAYPGTDIVKILWILPPHEQWSQFKRGNLVENELVINSIHAYQKDKTRLEAPESDDLSDAQVAHIYEQISNQARYDQMMEKAFPTKKSPEAI